VLLDVDDGELDELWLEAELSLDGELLDEVELPLDWLDRLDGELEL
jgi:hypothetical protein